MSDFKLLKSIMNPPQPAVEMVVEAAPTGSNRVEVDMVEFIGQPELAQTSPTEDHYTILCDIGITVIGPSFGEDGLSFALHGKLAFNEGEEDASFGYEYGSERGTAGGVNAYTTDFEWTELTPVQNEHNMELYRLPQEQFHLATTAAASYLTSMQSDAIKRIVNVKQLQGLLPKKSNGPD